MSRNRSLARDADSKSWLGARYGSCSWFRLLTTAPVSHQKRSLQNATNAIESKRKHSKINEPDHYLVAHNGLVAGSSPAGPTSVFNVYRRLLCDRELAPHQLFQRRPLRAPQTGNTILEGRGSQKALFAEDRRIGKCIEQKCRVGEYCGSYGRQLQFAFLRCWCGLKCAWAASLKRPLSG
jgi:hypothetical protein